VQIELVPGLQADQVSRLQALGIHNCRQLLRATRRQEQLVLLSKAMELSPETLQGLVQRVELCQIRGVGPATLERLWEFGVDSLDALADQEPTALQAQFRQIEVRAPNLAVIEDWITQAQKRSRRQVPRLLHSYPT
jgi:predicted RecB family nuclease